MSVRRILSNLPPRTVECLTLEHIGRVIKNRQVERDDTLPSAAFDQEVDEICDVFQAFATAQEKFYKQPWVNRLRRASVAANKAKIPCDARGSVGVTVDMYNQVKNCINSETLFGYTLNIVTEEQYIKDNNL